LPETGTYSIFIDPPGITTASLGLLLSRTVEGTLMVAGPAVTFSTSRVGQDGRYTFTAQAGAPLTLVTSGSTFASFVAVRLYGPDGGLYFNSNTYPNESVTFDFTPATTGTYSIDVDPAGASIGQFGIRLAAEATGSIVVDSAETTVSMQAGQNGRYTFSGTAGDRLGLGVTSLTATPSGQNISITIFKPDGVRLVNCSALTAAGSCNLPALPETGTYSIFIDPPGITTASLGLLLSRTVEGTLMVAGPAVTFSTSRVGQDGRYTFTAQAGTPLTLLMSGATFASFVAVKLHLPNGSQYSHLNVYPSQTNTLNFAPATTGIYSIEVDPNDSSIGQVSLQVTP
ncbi:pre-peptidase C-terminal domain-containing protein, partial [Myxococcus qinghaiensis]|uniref:pre-peptidase C-terminal domain-containing protein n=1 Tax=Myxococcus qinghaiensis TaxID=2906758 RepID=UPI002B21D8F2